MLWPWMTSGLWWWVDFASGPSRVLLRLPGVSWLLVALRSDYALRIRAEVLSGLSLRRAGKLCTVLGAG